MRPRQRYLVLPHCTSIYHSSTHIPIMTLRTVAVTTDNTDILSPSYSILTSPASSALLVPDSNCYTPGFLPASRRPGATSPTSHCLGAGQHLTVTSHYLVHPSAFSWFPCVPARLQPSVLDFFVSTPLLTMLNQIILQPSRHPRS